MESWDPLQESSDTDASIISAAQKRQIKNILKSYVGMYDSFSELIQNSMDAVDKRDKIEDGTNYIRRLWLTIDLSENSFTITDNGIAFNEKEFKSFLAPNISFKGSSASRGNKGVGATYIAYGFNYLQFGTKSEHHTFTGEMLNGREWVDDHFGIVTRPIVNSSSSHDKAFNEIDRGATFKIKFGGEGTRPKDLSWYSAKTASQWLFLLLLKTPLGSLNFLENGNEFIKFDLTVIDKNNKETTISDEDACYIYPHKKIKASFDLKEILSTQQKLFSSGKDASKLPSKYSNANGIFEFFTTTDILGLKILDPEYIDVIKQYSIEAYGYFTYSTSVWDQFNDKLAQLRKSYRVIKGGLQLANNKMIQGELITIPLTSNIGYQNQTHIIVQFNDADPDLGRKGFQPELKEVAERISVLIVNRFKLWRKQLKQDSGAKPDIVRESDLHEWIKEQEKYEEQNPLVLSNKNFFIPINEISISSIPQSEQDVIVLFNQLIAGGVIRGINLLATSQVKQYDSVFKFIVKEPLKNHEFDKELNPLGVEELHFDREHISPPKILEYKYNLDALIHEFETEYKNEKEIHLCVAWKMGSEWRKNYTVTSYLDLDNLHLRAFHGLTHALSSGNTSFYVIILEELIDFLNDVDTVQDYQKSEYGDDLF